MSTKTGRFELRMEPDRQRQIQAAAIEVNEGTSEFIRNAAYERADRILALSRRTTMPADQFDSMMASLDEPDAAPELAKAVAKPRAFKRQ